MNEDRILITGGAGFVGWSWAKRLGDVDITLIDLPGRFTEEQKKHYNCIECDISDTDKMSSLDLNDIDYVYHIAAQPGGRSSLDDPQKDCMWNCLGTVNVVELCRRIRPKKVIYISSMAVYGNQKNVTEETLTQPASYYGVSKLAGEYYTKLLWEFDKIPYTIFRLFATYGYGQDLNVMNQGIVSIYLKLALMSNTLDITLGKDSKRQLIHIDDVTSAFTYAPDVITDNKTYNLTYDETITPEKIINQLSKSLGRELMINEIEGYEGDQTMITGIANKFWADTGWSPKGKLETGVNTFVKEVQRETKN